MTIDRNKIQQSIKNIKNKNEKRLIRRQYRKIEESQSPQSLEEATTPVRKPFFGFSPPQNNRDASNSKAAEKHKKHVKVIKKKFNMYAAVLNQ